MKIQIVIEADFNEEELAKLKDEKTGLIPSKGEYADSIIVGHDNGIGMIHVYNPTEYGMKNFKGGLELKFYRMFKLRKSK